MIHHGDCLDWLKSLPDNSADALVTDPPAGIGFMGKAWDKFGGTRGMKPSTIAKQKATEKRNEPFGRSGVPAKPAPGAREGFIEAMREVFAEALRVLKPGAHGLVWSLPRTSHWTATALEDAGFEIRDRLGHVFGTGFPKSLDVSKALDKAAGATREVVGTERNWGASKAADGKTGYGDYEGAWDITAPATPEAKQWDGWGTALKPAVEDWWLVRKPLDSTVAANVLKWGVGGLNVDGCRVPGDAPRWPPHLLFSEHADELLGDAAKFFPRFRYQAKPSRRERGEGNKHPTVKPVELMRWLCRLITPPGGLVLDPFAGSGTTGVAALAEGFRFLGCEQDPAYAAIARQRLNQV